MDITDSEEELFLTQNSFSQDILQPNFSLGSIFNPVVGSDEPAPRNSCAKGCTEGEIPQTKAV